MSKTIESVPDYLTREQYLAPLKAIGLDVADLVELRYSNDGIHALVYAREENGLKIVTRHDGYRKHRIFIPIRDDERDPRTTRVKDVV